MDSRASTTKYYDLDPGFPRDVPFYLQQLPSAASSVLELGCGTGRVMLPLAKQTRFVHGIDSSPAMIARCQDRLSEAGIGPDRAVATVGEITQLRLPDTYDLIVAPFRVFQNLATDEEVAGLFATVRMHLAPGGHCILNTFRPKTSPEALIAKWKTPCEELEWELPIDDGVIRKYVRRSGVRTEPLVLYPELIYRRYRGSLLEEEVVSPIAMRCWYPEEFQQRVRAEGFVVTGSWGGYDEEPYGTGTEQIIAFTKSRS